MTPNSSSELIRLLKIIGYNLGDNVFFKDLSSARAKSVATFKSGQIIFPRYAYPKLEPGASAFQRLIQKRAMYLALLDSLDERLPEPERTIIAEALERSVHASDIVIGASAMNSYKPLTYGVGQGTELFKAANLLVYGRGNSELFQRAYSSLWNDLYKAAASNNKANKAFEVLKQHLTPPTETGSAADFLPSERVQTILKKHINKKFETAFRYLRHIGDDKYYTAQECREIINLILRDYGLDQYGWRAVCTTSSPLWSANSYTKRISIPLQSQTKGEALKRYIIHEFGVHAHRSFNGAKHSQLPLLAHNLPHNVRAEEGIAILFESVLDSNFPPFGLRRAVERYVAYGLATGMDGRPRNARELFDILKLIFLVFIYGNDRQDVDPDVLSSDIAFSYVDNLFRGTPFTQRGIVYSRSKIYLEGLVSMSHYFEEHYDEQSFERVFAAKYDPTNNLHVELLKKYGVL